MIPDLSAFSTEAVPDTLSEIPAISSGQCIFHDLLAGRCTAEELAACLSDEELSLILTGDGNNKRKEAGITQKREIAKGEGSHTNPVKSLRIPASTMQDGPAGVRASAFTDPIPPIDEINGTDCVCYPSCTALTASWNKALIYEAGAAISADMARYGLNGLCAPGINLHRNPRCGRNFESFSEDPLLASEMAIGFIRGIEERKTISGRKRYTILKHFACNNCKDPFLT